MNEDDLKEEVQTWLTSLAAEWYDTGLKKHLPRYQKCIEIEGDNVEKSLTCVIIKIKPFKPILSMFYFIYLIV